jgi:hypothetical protein
MVALDDISKTEIRVEVMREYHRRRKQGKTLPTNKTTSPKPTLSAKSQTQKFRLGREKNLQPWVRVKPFLGKKNQVTSHKSNSPVRISVSDQPNHHKTGQESIPPERQIRERETQKPEALDHAQTDADVATSNFDPELPVAPQWLSASESSTETTSLYQSPATGVLDPFSAISLPITPRTQLLLHHYCELQISVVE